MPRSPVLPWLIAAAVGVALTAPQACHTNVGAAPPDSPPAAEPLPEPAPPVPTTATASTSDTTQSTADATTERAARPDLPDGFVRLSEVAPGIAQEMRYTTAYNFVGTPIDGYLAPECILTMQAAEALADVAASLAGSGLGLKVYDCYRPQAAVTHFVRWANDPEALAMKDAFYPEEPKGRLFSRGYIATRSGHSRGSTVDLTLVRLPVSRSVQTDFPTPDGHLPRCDRPLSGPTGPDIMDGGRFYEGDLDMGTAYDCLSPLAATDHPRFTGDVRRNRQRLRAAMSDGGFRNYSKEWWHFTLRGEPHTGTYFDFPVE
ncbi:M15 family metallopeptidase [Rubrivirga sp. IMCC43871]|uniref:M15 family metallopeptidase n=1 Tax=Rubrivirga sp. IMCC43871 TaxID=3391575 RepID=UPI0039901A54